jgi:decaprenylphospho-beta-D-ribofuranose 2-oxidase
MLPPNSTRSVAGFGMSSKYDGYLFQPTTIDGIKDALAEARASGRQVVLRGAGRSYGDASILAESVVLDLTLMNRFVGWDAETGIADCEAGVTIEQLWRTSLPNGWWPPVVSGTMFPTIGGALAMNIHGKNDFAQGTLGEHVLEIDFLRADGTLETILAGDPLFRSTVSSAGLLGVITRVKLQLKKVLSGDLRVYAESLPNWDAQFEAFVKRIDNADYMVSWVDCFASGKTAGRGLFHAAWHQSEQNLESLLEMHQDLPSRILGFLPKSQVWRILKPLNNRVGMKTLNAAKYLSARLIGNRKMHNQSLVEFSFLLDYVPDWRNAYLPGGFIQYQSFVPKETAQATFACIIAMSQQARLEPFLGVMKRHRKDDFLISHGVDGYSLALDYKVTEQSWPELQALCHRMNDTVLAAGGKFYWAKDSTLRPKDVRSYLGPKLDELRMLKLELDPESVFSSALARRLDLFPGNLNQ